jgi:hypothetical protein
MKKESKIRFALIVGIALLVLPSFLYAQYSLTITAPTGFKYYGDYSGIVYDSAAYMLGPYANPFTVTIVPIATTYEVNGCGGISSINGFYTDWYEIQTWTVNGELTQEKQVTVRVDNAAPQGTATLPSKLTRTGDGFFNMSNRGTILWFCAPVYKGYIGSAFTNTLVCYTSDLGAPIPSDLNLIVDIVYRPEILTLDSITLSNPANMSYVDTTTPGIIRISHFDTADINGGSFAWKVIDDASTDIRMSVYDKNTTSPIVVNGNTLAGYTTKIYTKKKTYAFGDADGNDRIDIVDALLVARSYVGLQPLSFETAAADVNMSGSIDIIDALNIARYYVGLISKLPV